MYLSPAARVLALFKAKGRQGVCGLAESPVFWLPEEFFIAKIQSYFNKLE